jgi:hypothetical protein
MLEGVIMRRSQKFLLTVLLPEETDAKGICGKVRYIPTGSEKTFSNLDELAAIVYEEIQDNDNRVLQNLEVLNPG